MEIFVESSEGGFMATDRTLEKKGVNFMYIVISIAPFESFFEE